jgi:hypothetical protein
MAQHSLGSLLDAKEPTATRAVAPTAQSDRRMYIKVGVSVFALLVAAVLLGFQLFSGGESAASLSRKRDLIDSETLEVFRSFPVEDGTKHPWPNPKTGKNTLFPVERCFWTKDGKARAEPRYVLLNMYRGEKGDTICPDCGRKVVPHNPPPPMKLINEAMGIKEEESKGANGGK